MQDDPLSLVFLPTLKCNAACDYCFENKTNVSLALDQLSTILNKVFDYLDEKQIASLNIYWQGGEIMTLSPSWVLRAGDLITDSALWLGARKSPTFFSRT